MTDTALNPGEGPEQARTLERTANVKTQVVALDIGGAAGPEKLVDQDNPVPVGGSVLDAIQVLMANVQTLLTTLSSTVGAADSPFVNGRAGQVMLAKRRDSDSTIVADGDLNALNMDEEGRLKVASKPASYSPTVGSITSATSTVAINTARFSNLMIHCKGTFAGVNVAFEGSLDSTNGTDGTWFGVQAIRSNANTVETTTGALNFGPAYAWELSVNAMSWFRVRATAWTSGAQVWTMIPGTYATEPIPGAQVTAVQSVACGSSVARIGFISAAGTWYDDTSTLLAANATFTGTLRDVVNTNTGTAFGSNGTFAKEVRASAETDVAGTLWMEASRDNGATWRRIKSVATTAVAGGGQYAEIIHSPSWRYVRVGFTNGATAQTRLTLGSITMAA